MATIIFKGHNNSVAAAPTKDVPFWHFICKCGDPVSTSLSWWNGKNQVHFACLPKLFSPDSK